MGVKTLKISDVNKRTGKTAWLREDAALQYEVAKSHGLPEGCVNDAGRTHAEQKKMYDDWVRGGRKNPPSVARPGTSLHETGIAIDLAEPARSWMHEHGAKFGFINPDWAKRPGTFEPWHFEFYPHLVKETTMELSKKSIEAIAKAVSEHRNKLSTNAAEIAGSPTMTVRLALQQNIYARRDVRTILARVRAIEQAVNKGSSVSAADVARELRPLLAADVRAAVKQAVAGLPDKDANQIAEAVVAKFADVLAGED